MSQRDTWILGLCNLEIMKDIFSHETYEATRKIHDHTVMNSVGFVLLLQVVFCCFIVRVFLQLCAFPSVPLPLVAPTELTL